MPRRSRLRGRDRTPRVYREAPLNSIWEGSGNVNALDLLRALGKEPASLNAWLAEVGAVRGNDARFDAAVTGVLDQLARPFQLEAQARLLAERMALLLQGLDSHAERSERSGRCLCGNPVWAWRCSSHLRCLRHTDRRGRPDRTSFSAPTARVASPIRYCGLASAVRREIARRYFLRYPRTACRPGTADPPAPLAASAMSRSYIPVDEDHKSQRIGLIRQHIYISQAHRRQALEHRAVTRRVDLTEVGQ